MRSKETVTTDTSSEKTVTINRYDRVLLIIGCFLLFVGTVLACVSVWQGTQRNARIDHIDKVVTQAAEAAEDARQVVKAAVAAQNTPEARRPLEQLNDIQRLINENNSLIKELQNR